MAVLNPLKVTISNFPGDHTGSLIVPNFPADEKKGSHTIPFTSTIYIDKSDFKEVFILFFNLIKDLIIINYNDLFKLQWIL